MINFSLPVINEEVSLELKDLRQPDHPEYNKPELVKSILVMR